VTSVYESYVGVWFCAVIYGV